MLLLSSGKERALWWRKKQCFNEVTVLLPECDQTKVDSFHIVSNIFVDNMAFHSWRIWLCYRLYRQNCIGSPMFCFCRYTPQTFIKKHHLLHVVSVSLFWIKPLQSHHFFGSVKSRNLCREFYYCYCISFWYNHHHRMLFVAVMAHFVECSRSMQKVVCSNPGCNRSNSLNS